MPCRAMRLVDGQYRACYEVLDHGADSIDRQWMAGGLVIRDGHGGDQIGLIANPVVTPEMRLGGPIAFCAGNRAQEIAADAAAGIRCNLSVEYEVSPDGYKPDGEREGLPVVRAMRWTPLAAAFVPVPADPSVGVGRELENDSQGNQKTPETATTTGADTVTVTTTEGARHMADETKTEGAETVTVNAPDTKAAKDRSAEIVEMYRLARLHNYPEPDTAAAVTGGVGFRAFAETVMNHVAKAPKEPTAIATAPMLNQRDHKQYSLIRALMNSNSTAACFEREVSDQIAAMRGRPALGIWVPDEVLTRTLSVTGSGASLVSTDLLTGSFIDLLKAKLITSQLGVSMLTGLRGDIEVPKQTAGGTAYWLATDGTVTASDQTLTLVKASPKTVAARTLVGRSMKQQSSMDAERFVVQDIQNTLAQAIDTKFFNGTGAAGEIQGLLYADDINSITVTSATPTLDQILDFPEYIESDNANFGGQKWAMPPPVWAELAGQIYDTGSGLTLLNATTQSMIGFPYAVSTNVPARHLFFGSWNQAVLCMWGGLDMQADPYSSSATGGTYVTAFQDIDLMIRNGKSFAYSSTVSAS